MDMDAFADSAVEHAANGGGAGQWPPSHIAHYDYDAQSGNNSLVDMNLDEDPMLGDITEEHGLLSGDIEPHDRYKPKNNNHINISFNNNNNKKKKQSPSKQRKNNNNNHLSKHQSMIMQQASGLKQVFKDKLSSQTQNQMDKHQIPTFESNLGITQWCVALFYWIPIRYLCFMGSLALFILPFLDVRFQSGMTFVEWLLYWYIQLFAIIGIFIESPTWILTRKIQLTIYKWCRILRRTWGRALFYTSISLLTFAELQGGSVPLSMLAGVYMLGMSFIMMMFSILAAKQYRLMYWYMATGGNINGKDLKLVGDEYRDENNNGIDIEYNKLVSRVVSYFNELDHDRNGRIGAGELHTFAEQALKRNLSNSERYTIQTFLDAGCNGYISREDWVKQFCDYGRVRFL